MPDQVPCSVQLPSCSLVIVMLVHPSFNAAARANVTSCGESIFCGSAGANFKFESLILREVRIAVPPIATLSSVPACCSELGTRDAQCINRELLQRSILLL